MNNELQEKIRLSRQAFEIATQVSGQLQAYFQINNLGVAATMPNTLAVSGSVGSEQEQMEVAQFLKEQMPDWQLVLNLNVE
ncbi:hypothetical protein HNQ91_000170 [Filimonas zeae]|uniref:Uncharacterized protein n=1 Tax=Filimonas zeae TaxID=1737353 RepID=A0A917IKL9_9BACT|nr:hypothetical protein [Filimonas zeae]MDR6337148.1 hypothetical protein [Filimonas zeae]GGH57224.1 hypothetical protein GCM10011379_01670 [Filimonas zeae]